MRAPFSICSYGILFSIEFHSELLRKVRRAFSGHTFPRFPKTARHSVCIYVYLEAANATRIAGGLTSELRRGTRWPRLERIVRAPTAYAGDVRELADLACHVHQYLSTAAPGPSWYAADPRDVVKELQALT